MQDINQNQINEQAQIAGANLMQKIEMKTAAAVNDTPPEQGNLIEMPKKRDFLPCITQYERYYNEITNAPPPIKTGFAMFDTVSGGLYNGVSVIGGLSGTGKTALACQIADNVAENGVKVLFLSLEMKERYIFERLNAIHFRKEYNIFNDIPFFQANIYPRIGENKSLNNIFIYDLHFNDKTAINCVDKTAINCVDKTAINCVEIIKQFCNEMRNTHGEKQDLLVIIDHLQHIENVRKSEQNDFLTINDAFRAFEKVADEKDIKMLVLSQLNRAAYNTAKDTGIQMQDFKGASRIEQGAVMLVGITNGENGEKRLNICKNRFNKSFDGFIHCDFNGVFFTEKASTEPLPLQDNETQSGGQW